jgi:hypothetical protein
LTYHYVVAEVFRVRPDLDYDRFWAMSRTQQADLAWRELFVKRSPVSESCRGVLTVLNRLGLDPNAKDLAPLRKYFKAQKVRSYTDRVFQLANVRRVYMTNDPLDPREGPRWRRGFDRDARFLGVLRLDSAIRDWPGAVSGLRATGYDADASLSGPTLKQVRNYLTQWCRRLRARYMAVSMPPSFRYPQPMSSLATLLTKAVLPVARDRGIPVALMMGSRETNPRLKLAGVSVGKADMESLERLAYDFDDVRFLVTVLSRENVHELCVAARKFKNVTPFGCWWFLNNPSLIREITLMRLEMLGLSFIPQHSDARVLDQLIYKWDHSRKIVAAALAEKYAGLLSAGRRLTTADIRRDVRILFEPGF